MFPHMFAHEKKQNHHQQQQQQPIYFEAFAFNVHTQQISIVTLYGLGGI